MSDDLKKALDYAALVNKVLPVDHEADRRVDAMLAKYYASLGPGRKLKLRTK